jgi:hypothetical protein
MRNITVTIPDDSYTRARVWAAERNTSISAVVRYMLETLPGLKRASKAFPLHNPNPVNTGQQPAPSEPPQNNFASIFTGESVEPRPTDSES